MAFHKHIKPDDIIYGKSVEEINKERTEATPEIKSAVVQIADMATKLSAIYTNIKWRPFPLFSLFCGSENKNELDEIEKNLGYEFTNTSELSVIDNFIKQMNYMEHFLYNKMLLNSAEHKAAGGSIDLGIDSLVHRINTSGARDDDRMRLVALMLKTIHEKYSSAIKVFAPDMKKHAVENYGNDYADWREKTLPDALKKLKCPDSYLRNNDYKEVFVEVFKPSTTHKKSM